MGAEEELQAMINQTVELAISQKDAYFKEIEASNEILKIKDSKEFVFGLIPFQNFVLPLLELYLNPARHLIQFH